MLDRLGEVASVFLRLGLTSFGGPIAHIGYIRRAVVLLVTLAHQTLTCE